MASSVGPVFLSSNNGHMLQAIFQPIFVYGWTRYRQIYCIFSMGESLIICNDYVSSKWRTNFK